MNNKQFKKALLKLKYNILKEVDYDLAKIYFDIDIDLFVYIFDQLYGPNYVTFNDNGEPVEFTFVSKVFIFDEYPELYDKFIEVILSTKGCYLKKKRLFTYMVQENAIKYGWVFNLKIIISVLKEYWGNIQLHIIKDLVVECYNKGNDSIKGLKLIKQCLISVYGRLWFIKKHSKPALFLTILSIMSLDNNVDKIACSIFKLLNGDNIILYRMWDIHGITYLPDNISWKSAIAFLEYKLFEKIPDSNMKIIKNALDNYFSEYGKFAVVTDELEEVIYNSIDLDLNKIACVPDIMKTDELKEKIIDNMKDEKLTTKLETLIEYDENFKYNKSIIQLYVKYNKNCMCIKDEIIKSNDLLRTIIVNCVDDTLLSIYLEDDDIREMLLSSFDNLPFSIIKRIIGLSLSKSEIFNKLKPQDLQILIPNMSLFIEILDLYPSVLRNYCNNFIIYAINLDTNASICDYIEHIPTRFLHDDVVFNHLCLNDYVNLNYTDDMGIENILIPEHLDQLILKYNKVGYILDIRDVNKANQYISKVIYSFK